MGAWGALIMGFFGAVFASMTLYWEWHLHGVALALPFLGFVLIGIAAYHVIRTPGEGIRPSPREERAIMWSSIGEGVGLFLAANIVMNLHRPDLLLPSMALVVGLHFLPIAFAAGFRPFYGLGTALIVAAIMGFVIKAPTGRRGGGVHGGGCALGGVRHGPAARPTGKVAHGLTGWLTSADGTNAQPRRYAGHGK